MNNSGGRRGEDNDSDSEDSGPSWWTVGLGVAAGVATLAGGIYMFTRQAEERQENHARQASDSGQTAEESMEDDEIAMDNITDAVSRLAVLGMPTVNNLNSLLDDIHLRYIVVKKEEFSRRYNVFSKVFYSLHKSMKAVDSYYERYSSRVQLKPEEFNINIVIGLPVNIYEDYRNPDESDIVIEPKQASFVQLRAGTQYQKILVRDGNDYLINKQAYLWLDDRKYILRSKFMSWFQRVVDRALNRLQNCVRIDGTEYRMTTSANGAAYTLWITNSAGFRLNVDLIPALRFPEERWLGRSKAYRDIPQGCSVDYWIVVPKPNKFGANSYDEDRSWHVDMYDQEKNSQFFSSATGVTLGKNLKKLRDAQQMVHIENYYIETLFLWKCLEMPQSFWQRDVASVFQHMLQVFLEALEVKNISFFWKKSHNLIENVPEHILKGYARNLMKLITELEDNNNYMAAAKCLLSEVEYTEYKGLLSRSIYYR